MSRTPYAILRFVYSPCRHTDRWDDTGRVSVDRPIAVWPLHDVVVTNIVWCIAYQWEVGR